MLKTEILYVEEIYLNGAAFSSSSRRRLASMNEAPSDEALDELRREQKAMMALIEKLQATNDAQQATIDAQQATNNAQQATNNAQEAKIDAQQATNDAQQASIQKLQARRLK